LSLTQKIFIRNHIKNLGWALFTDSRVPWLLQEYLLVHLKGMM